METKAMETFTTTVTAFFTAFVGWMTTILQTIENQPLLLVFVLLAIAAIVSRLIRKWLPGL